jgi:hypothetical protein
MKVGGIYENPYSVRVYSQILPIADYVFVEKNTPFVLLEVLGDVACTWLRVLLPTGSIGYVFYNKHWANSKLLHEE